MTTLKTRSTKVDLYSRAAQSQARSAGAQARSTVVEAARLAGTTLKCGFRIASGFVAGVVRGK